MATSTDNGNQEITFDYKNEASGETFNRLLYGVTPAGIYGDLPTLTKYSNTIATVSSFRVILEDSENNIAVKVYISDTASAVVSSSLPLVVIRYVWSDSAENYAEIIGIAEEDIDDDDVIIGLCNFSGTVLGDFDYTDQVDGNLVTENEIATSIETASLTVSGATSLATLSTSGLATLSSASVTGAITVGGLTTTATLLVTDIATFYATAITTYQAVTLDEENTNAKISSTHYMTFGSTWKTSLGRYRLYYTGTDIRYDVISSSVDTIWGQYNSGSEVDLMMLTGDAHLIIGGGTDNGVDTLQVGGTTTLDSTLTITDVATFDSSSISLLQPVTITGTDASIQTTESGYVLEYTRGSYNYINTSSTGGGLVINTNGNSAISSVSAFFHSDGTTIIGSTTSNGVDTLQVSGTVYASGDISTDSNISCVDLDLSGDLTADSTTISGTLTADSIDTDTLNSIDVSSMGFASFWSHVAPEVSSSFSMPGINISGLTYDSSTGNLISCDSGDDMIYVHDGISSTISSSFSSPSTVISGITYDSSTGNLITCDSNTELIYVHDGISSTTSSSFSCSSSPTGLAYDSPTGNLISCDSTSDMIYVHDGISATTSSSFSSPGTFISGITYDSSTGNLISCDSTSDMIYVHDGITSTILYSYDAPSTNVGCLAYGSSTGDLISGDTSSDLIYNHTIKKALITAPSFLYL